MSWHHTDADDAASTPRDKGLNRIGSFADCMDGRRTLYDAAVIMGILATDPVGVVRTGGVNAAADKGGLRP